MKLLNRYIITFVLFLGLVNYCYGDYVRLNYCETEDCLTTANDFDRLIDWSAIRCDDFYKFACGNGPPEKLLALYPTQEEYLKHLLDVFILNDDVHKISQPSFIDAPLVQLLKQYYKSCEDEAMLQRVGLQPIISFLNQIPSKKTWWELEKWAVSIGMNSTIFSTKIESHLDRKDKKGAIILGPPDTRVYTRYYWQTSENLTAKLRAEGLSSTLADKLVNGMNMEFELYQIVQDPRLARRHHYGERILTPISNWKDLWEKNRTTPSNLEQIDWEMYLEDYWKTSVMEKEIILLLKNATFKQWIEYPYFVTTFGRKVEQFTEENMKNIIVWRMVNQLVEYADRGTRTIMELSSIRNCRTHSKNSVLHKNYWYKVFPKSVKKMVRKMYINIDLQIKLLNYKLMPKISPEHEPLTHRERKKRSELQRQQAVVTKKVDYLDWEEKNATQYLPQLETDASVLCWETVRLPTKSICRESDDKKSFAENEIPNVRNRIKIVKDQLVAKRIEKIKSRARVESFEKKNSARIKPYNSKPRRDTKREALINYVKDKSYPRFPFENAFTRPTLITEILPDSPTYVDLALGLKKWERGMLLQPPEILEFEEKDMKLLLHTFPYEAFARIKKNRPASLNYGALGSVLGSQQMTKLSNLEIDRMKKIKHCLKKNSHASKIDDGLAFRISELSIKKLGLQAAWNARTRDAAINGDRDERLLKEVHDASENITKLNNDQLFFVSFANANCAKEQAGTLVNETLKHFPKFYDVFACNTSSMRELNKCISNISHKLKP